MIEKSKIKLKKGIAFVLAALQIGLVSSCSKKVSDDDYNKALEVIEKLENANLTKDEDINNLESELESLRDEINKLKGDSESPDNEQELSVSVNTSNAFNLEIAKKLGLTEEVYNLSGVKAIIDELNALLSSRENVKCEVKAGAVSNQVKFIVNDNEYYSVLYKDGEYLYFTMVNPNNSLTYSVSLDNAKSINYLGYNVEWNVDNKTYTMSNTHFYKSYNSVITSFSYNGPDINNPRNQFSMYVYLEKIQNVYKLKFNDVDQNHDTSKNNLVTIEISKEDYDKLKTLMDSYKEKGDFGDIVSYCSEDILEVIYKYYKEDDCKEYVPILNGSVNIDLSENPTTPTTPNNSKPSSKPSTGETSKPSSKPSTGETSKPSQTTNPTEPAATEPAPTEPAPTEPAPTEPPATEPAPTEPAPTEPPATEPTTPEQPGNSNVVDSTKPFNNNVASEVGLSSDDLTNSSIKDGINRLNAYLSKYIEAYGAVHYYIDKANNVIYYYVNDLSVEEIKFNNIASVGYANRVYEISLNAPLNGKSYYAQIGLGNGNKETTSLSTYTSWNYDGGYFSIDEYLLASNWTQKQISWEDNNLSLVACIEKFNEDYALRLSTNGSELDIFIAKEDYDALQNAFSTYASSEKTGNVFTSCQELLIGTIQKYGKEAECTDFIGLINNPNMTR